MISGCAEKECKVDEDCLSKNCFTAQCKDNNCIYSIIPNCCGNEKCETGETYESCADDCPNCNDYNECTINDRYDYHEQKCINEPVIPCCGNNICDEGAETHSNCQKDCPNCDDGDKCTKDSFDYNSQQCINEEIKPCCGDGICAKDEICSEDCVLEEGGYADLWVVPCYFDDADEYKDLYGVKNCFAESLTLVSLVSTFNGNEEARLTPFNLIAEPGVNPEDFKEISPEICEEEAMSGVMYLDSADFRAGEFKITVKYRFKYKGKTLEFNGGEKIGKIATVREGMPTADANKEVSAKGVKYRIDRYNVKVVE